MKRPIIWANIFLAVGILLGLFAGWQTVLFLSGGMCVCLYAKFKYWPAFIFIAFALAGFAGGSESWLDPMAGSSFYVDGAEGTVTEHGLTASGNPKLTVETGYGRVMVYTSGNAVVTRVKKIWHYGTDANGWSTNETGAEDEPVSDAEVEPPPPGLGIGSRIRFSGLLLPLEHPSAPGEYDEFLHLRAMNINAKIFPHSVEILDGADERPYIRLLVLLRQTRDRLADIYGAAFPEREAGIMKSLLLGDKSGLDEDSAELYRAAGIYHLLCISGLHIGIFMLAVGRLFKIFLNERRAWLLGLAVLILYALLTGASVSTVRAVTMGGVFVFSKLLFKDYDLLASTSFACIALLLYQPLYLYEAGFQLSFGAVFGIGALTAPVERGLTVAIKRLPFKNTLAAGIAATAATYPVLMYHFNEISAYGILVNLFVIPTSSVLVVFGLLTGLAGLVSVSAAEFLAGVSFYLLKFYDAVCNFFAGLPFAVISTGPVSVLTCALMYAAAGFFALGLSKFKEPS